jgi:2-desacetyl-2-hydroxyethyl bacteriochlorophyllide A dehydrogenase
MLAATSHGPEEIRVEEVARPQIESPTDAIVRVTTAALCGSDLHVYHGKIPAVDPGWIVGHEFCGVVEETGDGVTDMQEGDRVVAAMYPACGHCPACIARDHRNCPQFGVFGMGRQFGNLQGAQAEYVRVPFADMTLRRIPEGQTDESTIFTGDILATAFTALKAAGTRAGDTIAIVGAGPVGQLIAMLAPSFGVIRTFIVDLVPARLAEAANHGAIPVDAGKEDPRDRILSDHGALVDRVFEAAGNKPALETAFRLVRVQGDVVLVGMLVNEEFPVSAGLVWLKNIQIHPVLGDPFNHREEILRLISCGHIHPERLVSHHMPLTEAAEAYRAFDAHEVQKVIFEVSA